MYKYFPTLLRFILRALPMKKGYTNAKLAKRILEDGEHYFTNGISSDEEELDFCSIISLALDEALDVNGEFRGELLNQIYNAAGFQHFWQG